MMEYPMRMLGGQGEKTSSIAGWQAARGTWNFRTCRPLLLEARGRCRGRSWGL